MAFKEEGSFLYRKHLVKYKVGNLWNGWYILVHISIDDKPHGTHLGFIPVRMPDIRRMVKEQLTELK